MDEFLYLEADEEITSVIDKLKGLEAKSVGLVAPKGSTIAQSLVSLKLIKKEAKHLGKTIAIITSDEVGRNLAAQVGLPIYADVKSRAPITPSVTGDDLPEGPIKIDMRGKTGEAEEGQTEQAAEVAAPAEEEKLPEGFTVNRYDEGVSEQVESAPVKSPVENEKTTANFHQRPVGDLKNEPDRSHLEAERPVRFEHLLPKSKKPKNSKPAIIFVICLIAFGVLAFFGDLLLAKVTVNISTPAEVSQKQGDVTVEKDRPKADFEGGIIPGVQTIKEKPVEKSYAATGEKDAGEKAKGTLTFKNEAGADESILAETVVKSSSGVEFTLDSAISVPKAALNAAGDKVLGQATGAVTAVEAGAGGNLPSTTTYAVTGKSKITASGATAGGVTKKIKLVTKSDIEKAKTDLLDSNKNDLINEVKGNKDDIVLDEAGNVEMIDFSTDKNADAESDKFTAKAKLKYTALTFKSNDFRQAVIASIEKTLPPDKGLIVSDSDTIAPKIKDNQVNIGKLVVTGTLNTHVGPKINTAQLSKKWRFKTLKTIRSQAEQIQGFKVESVELSPSFALPISPILSRNIKINIQYSQNGNPSP